MARLARVVLPGYPHHITQRGNRRQDVFFNESDYEHYLDLLKDWCTREDIEIGAYCLMTNHVHLIAKPNKKSNLGKAIGEVHRRYTRMVNFRENWKGYLWQGRFASYPLEKTLVIESGCLCRAQSSQSRHGQKSLGLSVEQHPCAPVRKR